MSEQLKLLIVIIIGAVIIACSAMIYNAYTETTCAKYGLQQQVVIVPNETSKTIWTKHITPKDDVVIIK